MNDISKTPNRRILIIDDNHAIHEDFQKILGGGLLDDSGVDAAAEAMFGEAAVQRSPERFEIDSAMQGRQGFELVQQSIKEGRPYAMAFVDGRMPPGWDGVETITKIWEVYPDLQVVMCTAYSDYSWDDMIAKIGQTDRLVILKKPFDTVEALQLANALTAKWALMREVKTQMAHGANSIAGNAQLLEVAVRKLLAVFEECWPHNPMALGMPNAAWQDGFVKRIDQAGIPVLSEAVSRAMSGTPQSSVELIDRSSAGVDGGVGKEKRAP
jgi:DNA-binding NtrC family response regulator